MEKTTDEAAVVSCEREREREREKELKIKRSIQNAKYYRERKSKRMLAIENKINGLENDNEKLRQLVRDLEANCTRMRAYILDQWAKAYHNSLNSHHQTDPKLPSGEALASVPTMVYGYPTISQEHQNTNWN